MSFSEGDWATPGSTAGGLKNWYTAERHPKKAGEWIYRIVPEIIEPLKRVFGI